MPGLYLKKRIRTGRKKDSSLKAFGRHINPGFPVETPPNLRSCKKGGRWELCPYPNKDSDLHTIETMIDNKHQFLLLQRTLQRMLRAAESGTLIYGKNEDVYAMRVQPAILELRLSRRVQYPDGAYNIRLYFSEPLSLPEAMVAARLRAKPASQAGLMMQNEHVRESYLRIKQYLGLE